MMLLFVTVCCTLASSIISVSVAPGDIDQTCRNEPDRKSVPKNQKVLLDTQDYREMTLLSLVESRIWKSIDFDEKPSDNGFPKWRDSSQTNDCLHSFLACDPDNKPQDNWMITQYINITDDGVNELTINMTFSTAQLVGQCPNCEQSFFVYSYETNVIDETGRVNQSFYMNTGARFFHTVGDVPQESDNRDISISSKGLYLSVVDRGSCTLVTRISVFYYVCPYQVVNMVVYPETVSPPSSSEDRIAIATCIDNASPVSGGSTNLECDSGGIWETSDISCICDPGYEVFMEACEACQEGEYKSIQGNEDCVECPENSNSTQTGATSCDCISGYYRASSENITVKCTAPPTAPVNVRDNSIGSTSVNISWSPPTDSGGRTDLYYTVTYSNGSFVSPVLSVGTGTQYTVTGLTPLTEYTISVTSVNGVSNQDSNTANRTTSIRVTTTNRGPTPPAEFDITTDPNTGTTSILDWKPPVNLYGTLMHYNILIATTDDPNLAEVVATTTDTTFDLNMLDNVEPGTYYVWVQAVTDNGMGDLSPSVSYIRVNQVPSSSSSSSSSTSTASSFTFSSPPSSTLTISSSSNELLVVALSSSIVVGILLLTVSVLTVILTMLVCYRKKRNSNISLKDLTMNQSYGVVADSACYVDIDAEIQKETEAMFSGSVIDKSRLDLIEKLGEGEFGVVYRGKLTGQSSNMSTAVAVKTLKGSVDPSKANSIINEALKMKSFNHLNVLPLIGICLDPIEAPCIIMPFMNEGSLLSYLRREKHNLIVSAMAEEKTISVTTKKLLSMCLQVANGMAYLADMKFVHRDLAARNCMISSNGIIKVADFGLSEDIYESEYFKQPKESKEKIKLPLKWMALESIHYRTFNEKTDVWSYGVVCWEVFTSGMSPYSSMSPKEVLDTLNAGQRLDKPSNAACSEEIYSLMMVCWSESASKRPCFHEIVNKLEHLIAPLAEYMDFTELYVSIRNEI